MPRKAKPKPKNANGEGSVFFDKTRNKWRACVYDPEGNRLRPYFNTKEEANEWILLKKAEFATKTYIPPSNMTVGEWLIEYIKVFRAPNMRLKSLERLLQYSAHLAPLSDIKLKDIEPYGIQKFYAELPEDMAACSKKKVCGLLKSCLKKAYALKMIREDVTLPVTPPANNQEEFEEVVVFTMEEIKIILASIQNSQYYSKYYTFFLLALTTGARLGELLGLKRECVFNGYIRIKNNLQYVKGKFYDMPPKTKAGLRNITIPSKMEALLKAAMITSKFLPKSDYVFHNQFGGPLIPRNMERAWERILKEAKIEHKKFHALRHTHATQLLAAGVPLLEVSKRLGHSSPAITLKLYAHAIPNYDHQVVTPAVEKIYALN